MAEKWIKPWRFVYFVSQISRPACFQAVWTCLFSYGGKEWNFMQSQNAADTFLLKWWPQIEANKNRIFGVAGGVIIVFLIASFISWRHEQNQIAAGEAMTAAIISLPPDADPSRIADTYLGIADQYRNTPAGERSLLQGAAALFAEGKYTDAQDYFEKFLEAHPDDDFSGQAALGVAKCLEAEGKLNDAAGAYQHVIDDFPDAQAVIDAKFSLALIEVQQKRFADAVQLFQDVAKSDPYGALGSEAAQYVFNLKSKVSASSAAAPATSPLMMPATPSAGTPAPAKAPASPAPFNLSH
jgi:TolA-binding protein